jgi:hypothetical protein
MIGEIGIYSIVDLQDCVGTNINHPDIEYSIGCNPYDMGSSEEIYNRVMGEIAPSEARVYRRVNNYYDMSPGFPSAWDRISKIGDTREERNSVVVHCLAGKGRTGSVLLYIYIRDIRNTLHIYSIYIYLNINNTHTYQGPRAIINFAA